MDVSSFEPGQSGEHPSAPHDPTPRNRRLIQASRALSRPIAGGDGSGPRVSPIGLRRQIRDMIESGTLPVLPDRRSWIGQGHGDLCLLCEQTITPSHWEHEVDIPPIGEIRTHGVCFRIWVEESEGLGKSA